MVSWKITAAQKGQRLNKYLMRKLPQAQSSFLYRMLRKKNITLNGKKASGSELLKEGDLVTLFLSDETIRKFGGRIEGQADERTELKTGQNTGARGPEDDAAQEYLSAYRRLGSRIGKKGILFENEDILIVVKPVGILSQKAGPRDFSMNEWLPGYLLGKGEITGDSLTEFRPSVCNRLDRNTGGILLCGKTLAGTRALSEMLRDRSVRKFYRAVVIGSMSGEGRITGRLTKDASANKVRFEVSDGSKDISSNSETTYRVLRTGEKYSLLELELITGRTHQIRSHLSFLGHPIGGDQKYGDAKANRDLRERYGVRGQLLWCCRIEFPKTQGALAPLSGRTISADPPALYEEIVW